MAQYTVSNNSVITSVLTPDDQSFLTCGGTNILPKVGTPYANFTAGSRSFKYIFNSKDFKSTIPRPIVTGYSADATATAPTTIKQFLYNGVGTEYVCGKFSLSTPTRTNIMWFNPKDTPRIKDADFLSLNISYNGASTTVNCMSPLATKDFSKIYIAGSFTDASITNGLITTTSIGRNMARLNVLTTTSWSIDDTFNTTGSSEINDANTIINCMILDDDNILYVGGSNGSNCLFVKYNDTTDEWVNLLGATPYAGSINVLELVSGKNKIAIGGKFVSIATATDCNNIVLYNITDNSWESMNGGVDTVPASPIYPDPQVFALSYIQSKNTLWVGGYFVNGGGQERNSIATYLLDNGSWGSVIRSESNVIGLKRDTDVTVPGVVYCLSKIPIDAPNIIVGGSFRINATKTNELLFNLIKITTNSSTSNRSTKYNIKSVG
jgi:hypothetical protein